MSNKYIIDKSKLQLGDVILTANKSATSKGIRVATLSKYSHAAIYVGGTIIEATLPGVFSISPQRLLFDSPKHVAIYRYNEHLTEEQIETVCNYARSKVGSLYALPEAITIRARSALKLKETRKQFCSRLVALAFHENEIDLKNLRYPANCTPKQLSLCKAFTKVEGIIKEANQHEIDFSHSDDPNKKHFKETLFWLNKVRKCVSSADLSSEFDIQTINDVSKFLLVKPEFDEKVCSYMDEKDYLTHYNFDMKNNPYRYNDKLLFKAARLHADTPSFLLHELNKENDIISLYIQNLNLYMGYFKMNDLTFYYKHCLLYMNLLTGIYVRMKFLNAVSKELGYIDISNESSNIMKNAALACGAGKRLLAIE
ncbi:hypothetical protein UA38_03835 [Photobacterium kishitanii]|uniref:Permuted papain-like amidase enzyme, YaeF/YiiX, C92 family n=1 Tax=Photobacterium kishitanii TaxID=318456 RepID=A0AAX0YV51_9GAMM|nr:YiiX/YebB-like N1pC/P60 family cysteine hydrolase [Photobacterium kishitanii]KJG58891.1 hypothetical protein UA38_03835 [Photobacterium kishitanii]KJG62179.1 hypothetical protein UA42_07310 [Photobacterium kishitanii]KJG67092.1 hypothetical protein UA40_03835 [Photobacterium kishitanii]KJG70664.1 hypothetical protein UA41_05555 [Photobacterium kishitanii]PSX20930.1 hypothetical protein C0W70_01465 [Photobacterium kishitanii]